MVLLMSVGDWIALGAFVLTAGAAVATVSVLIGTLREQVRGIDEKLTSSEKQSNAKFATLEQQVNSHINDHARHLDARVWQAVVDQLKRIEDRLDLLITSQKGG